MASHEQQSMNGMPLMTDPMLFIGSDEQGKWRINPETVAFLSIVKCPLSVVSIVGKYRTGKSYLMNRLFDRNSGFELGSTVQSKTKGIWMWARPHPQDPKRCLILLDTEGLHDVEKGDETHDMQLFTFALLLSNCLVYNAIGTFDDVIVQQLQLVAELTENIKIKKSPEEDETGNYFSKYFPSFFLVLRDFFLELEINGKKVTSDEYLEHALKPRSGNSKRDREYNAPRDCIRAFFPRRRCYTLPKPVHDNEKLRHLDAVKESDIRHEFLRGCKEVIQSILTEARPFMLEGNVINGPRFCDVAGVYVQAINDGAVPCIESTVELLKKNECNKALEEATTLYSQKMSAELQDKMPVESDVLLRIHGSIRDLAVDYFHESALFEDSGNYVEKLGENLESHFQLTIQENNNRSRDKSMQVLQKCFKPLEQGVRSGNFTKKGGYAEYKVVKEQAKRQYKEASGLGPMCEIVLNDFLHNTQAEEEAIIAADKALDQKEKELALEQERLHREEEKRKVMEQEQRELRQQFERQQREHNTMLNKMQADFEEKQRGMMADHMTDMAEKEKEYRNLIDQGLDRQAQQYKLMIDEMKQDRHRMDDSNRLQQQALEEYKTQQNNLMEEMTKQRELSQQQVNGLQRQLADMRKPKKKWCVVM